MTTLWYHYKTNEYIIEESKDRDTAKQQLKEKNITKVAFKGCFNLNERIS